MTVDEFVSIPYTKVNGSFITNLVLTNQKAFEKLLEYFLGDDMRKCQRASAIIGFIGDNNSEKLLPFFDDFLQRLENPLHDASIRNIVRLWQFIPIPEEYMGQVYEICNAYLCDIKRPIAIRVFSMTVMSKIALQFPELIDELVETIQTFYPHGSNGFKNRATKMLKKLKHV